jgi:indole-3-glycerol phosphate synthase
MSPTFLESMLHATERRLRKLESERAALQRAAAAVPPGPSWQEALAGPAVAVVAEIKRRSPSAGPIAERLSPGLHARAYVAGGAAAVSVLTEEAHFGGSLDDLAEVRRAVAVPLLRKDFVIDEIQLYEARIHGASAVLLVARVLDPVKLRDLSLAAWALGLLPVVEVHRLEELEVALRADPGAVGVNARNLDDFSLDREGIEPILRAVPAGMMAIAESGLGCRADVEQVAAWGADAVLVGTALAGAARPEEAVRALTGVARRGREESK